MQKINILLLFALIVLIIFFVPPFHWSIVVLLSLLVATFCGLICTVAVYKLRPSLPAGRGLVKPKVRIVSAAIIFLILTLQTLHVLTPLNFGLIVMLGVSLLAL